MNGNTPAKLAKTPDARKFFELIELGRATLQTRQRFFPKDIDTCSPEDIKAHANWRQYCNEQPCLYDGMQTTYHAELSKFHATYPNSSREEVEAIVGSINKALDYFVPLCLKQRALRQAIQTNNLICGGGEACAISFAYLAQHAKTPVEEIEVKAISRAHVWIILDRDTTTPVTNFRGWRDSFMIDPLYNRLFFYEFVKEYREDTIVKLISSYPEKIKITSSNQPIPSMPPQFLAMAALYNERLRMAMEDMKQVLTIRSEPSTKKE